MAHGEEAGSPTEDSPRIVTSGRPARVIGVHTEDLYEAFDRIGRESADLRGDTAAQLRRIDELVTRSATTTTLPPSTTPTTTAVNSPRRRALVAWLVGLVLVALTLWGLSRCGGSTTAGAPSASGATTNAGAQSPSSVAPSSVAPSSVAPSSVAPSSVAPSSTGVATTTHPMTWGAARVITPTGLVSHGPGVDAPGSDVAYLADPDGSSLDVYQRVTLAHPLGSVSLGVSSRSSLRSELADLPLTVNDLQVQLNGQAVVPTAHGQDWTAQRPDGAAVTDLVLRYRLGGAFTQLVPTQAGRYLALLTPLVTTAADGSATPGSPMVVHLAGSRLISLTCPAEPVTGRLCGDTTAGQATANLPAGAPAVFQLALDR